MCSGHGGFVTVLEQNSPVDDRVRDVRTKPVQEWIFVRNIIRTYATTNISRVKSYHEMSISVWVENVLTANSAELVRSTVARRQTRLYRQHTVSCSLLRDTTTPRIDAQGSFDNSR